MWHVLFVCHFIPPIYETKINITLFQVSQQRFILFAIDVCKEHKQISKYVIKFISNFYN